MDSITFTTSSYRIYDSTRFHKKSLAYSAISFDLYCLPNSPSTWPTVAQMYLPTQEKVGSTPKLTHINTKYDTHIGTHPTITFILHPLRYLISTVSVIYAYQRNRRELLGCNTFLYDANTPIHLSTLIHVHKVALSLFYSFCIEHKTIKLLDNLMIHYMRSDSTTLFHHLKVKVIIHTNPYIMWISQFLIYNIIYIYANRWFPYIVKYFHLISITLSYVNFHITTSFVYFQRSIGKGMSCIIFANPRRFQIMSPPVCVRMQYTVLSNVSIKVHI